MEKAYQLSEMLLTQINEYCGKYTSPDGKDVTTEDSLVELQDILEKGFALHNYLIEHKLAEDKPAILSSLNQLNKFITQLTITKSNAEKLRLSNAIQLWNQAKIAIAVLANEILNYKDTHDNKDK